MKQRAWRAAIIAAVILVGLSPSSPVLAAEPQVTIDPVGPYRAGSHEVTVTGSGFDPAANDGVGIYLVFGPLADAPTYHTDALLYVSARWIHAGAADAAGQAPLAADGTFTTTLTIEPRFSDGHGEAVDCLLQDCVIVTMAAHGVDDRTQDTFTPITFVEASPGATSSASIPASVTVTPFQHPSPSATPPADDGRPDGGWVTPAVSASIGVVAIGGAIAVAITRRRRPPDR